METKDFNPNPGESNFTAPAPSIPKSALFYAIVLSAISIALAIVAHITKWDTQSGSYKLLTWVIFIGGIIWTLWDFKTNRNQGRLKYGNGVGLSVLTGLITGVITAVYIVVYIKFINAGFIDEIMEQSYDQMVEQGLSETQIEQAIAMSESFMTPTFFAIMSVLGWTLISLIVGLIVSAILKRD